MDFTLTCRFDSGSKPKLLGCHANLTVDCKTLRLEKEEEEGKSRKKSCEKGNNVFENVQLAVARHTPVTPHHKPVLVPVYSRILILLWEINAQLMQGYCVFLPIIITNPLSRQISSPLTRGSSIPRSLLVDVY